MDIFEPRKEPARSIYLALKAEAKKRAGRSIQEWMASEREAVFVAAGVQAAILGLRAPTLEEVERAERYAAGSVDYGAKWAHQVACLMRESKQ